MKGGKSKLMGANKIARHPKTSTASLRKGTPTGASKGPYPFHAPSTKLSATVKGSDA